MFLRVPPADSRNHELRDAEKASTSQSVFPKTPRVKETGGRGENSILLLRLCPEMARAILSPGPLTLVDWAGLCRLMDGEGFKEG